MARETVSDETRRLSVTLDARVHDAFRDVALARGMSIARLVRIAVDEYVDHHEIPLPPADPVQLKLFND